MAFYDHETPGPAYARAYLVAVEQFNDIASQEMHRSVGKDLDLTGVFTSGVTTLGPGRYETVLYVGDLDGYPALVFTAPWGLADITVTKPSSEYLATIGRGLRELEGITFGEVVDYLADRPGVLGSWAHMEIASLLK
jgi:hypothetical protein